MEDEKLVSIIVPLYNVEEYLERCINSLIQQTYKAIEIILIDDGSTDNSGKICDIYAKKDVRVKVIHVENGGQARARNIGIDMASGDYINFVDSDDWMALNGIEIMVMDMQTCGADIVVSSYEVSTNYDFYVEAKSTRRETLSSQNAIEAYLYQNITSSPWAKLYRKKLFEGIRYPEGKIYEDVEPLFYLMEKAKSVVKTDAVTYFYFNRKNSTVKSDFNEKKMYYYYATNNLLNITRDRYPEFEMAALSRMVWAEIHLIVHMGKNRLDWKDEYQKLWNDIKKYRVSVIFKSKARCINKVVLMLSYGGPNTICFFYNYFRHV